MKPSPQPATTATDAPLPEDREIGRFQINVVATAPLTEDIHRRRVESLTRWLLESFNRQRKEASNVGPRSVG